MGTIRQKLFGDLALSHVSPLTDQNATILMVGEPQRMQVLKKHFPEQADLFFIEFCDLTREIHKNIQPASVIAPAMTPQFDCFDLAGFLRDTGFRGAYRIIPGDLPRPDIVRRELRSQFPDLNTDILAPAPAETFCALH